MVSSTIPQPACHILALLYGIINKTIACFSKALAFLVEWLRPKGYYQKAIDFWYYVAPRTLFMVYVQQLCVTAGQQVTSLVT